MSRLVAEIRALRGSRSDPFDIVVEVPAGEPTAPWIAAGATWALTGFDSQPRLAEVAGAIKAGPE